MRVKSSTDNQRIRNHIKANQQSLKIVYQVFLKMHAVGQMLTFLYHIIRSSEVSRSQIYEQFFQAPFVKQYCDQEGIEEATPEGARHRCPYLLNILAACGVIEASRDRVQVKKLVLTPQLVRPYQREEAEVSLARLSAVKIALSTSPERLGDEDLSIMRELFGSTFLTSNYYLTDFEFIED